MYSCFEGKRLVLVPGRGLALVAIIADGCDRGGHCGSLQNRFLRPAAKCAWAGLMMS